MKKIAKLVLLVTTVARDVRFRELAGIAKFECEDAIFVADSEQKCIWRVDLTSKEVSLYAGIKGSEKGGFVRPSGLAAHGSKSCLYVSDEHEIKKVLLWLGKCIGVGMTL